MYIPKIDPTTPITMYCVASSTPYTVYVCLTVLLSCLWLRWFLLLFLFLCLSTSKGGIPVGLLQGQECALLFCIHGFLMMKTAGLYQ
ncbi:hypothetical protein BDV41DRAFT_531334 [Aspergillus transmontanensis]|uniref:Uncharacterized protein n=1 Tax=Aspergillus transmontanensis TaxID=1034304 RepID=A0A5N6W3Q4_9EURO|nr:hypothetical protein BDV41DRAFT_531334 [Aspergillus transmontanensis]